jgi:hypothetical protein
MLSGGCDDELYCKDKRCVPRARLGESCKDSHCVSPAVCERPTCVAPTISELGQSCFERRCARGSFCADDKTCTKATLTLDAECGIVNGSHINNDCAPGMVCGSATFPDGGGGPGPGPVTRCVAEPKQGEPCLYAASLLSSRCESGLFCRDDATGATKPRCERVRSQGETCHERNECAADLECRAGTCKPAC